MKRFLVVGLFCMSSALFAMDEHAAEFDYTGFERFIFEGTAKDPIGTISVADVLSSSENMIKVRQALGNGRYEYKVFTPSKGWIQITKGSGVMNPEGTYGALYRESVVDEDGAWSVACYNIVETDVPAVLALFKNAQADA